MARVLSSSD